MWYNCEECDYDPPRLGMRPGDRVCVECAVPKALYEAGKLTKVSKYYQQSKKDFLDRVKQCEWQVAEDAEWASKVALKKEKKSKAGAKFVFITIQDFKRRIGDLENLQQFIKRIKYCFTEAIYCIESGKVPLPNSNLK